MRWTVVVPVAVALAALTSQGTSTAAAPSAADTTQWPAGGRFVDAGSDTTGLANDIYVNGLPPELRPQVFVFQRVQAGGWQAELDFPAPVVQLHHYLAGDSNDAGDAFPDEAIPVRHTVALVLQPPQGDPTDVTVQADGSTVVTKAGAQIATSKSVFVGNRLIIAIPAAARVGPDWTVQAVIRITGDQPLRPVVGGRTGLPNELMYATQPAVVGVLTGDTARSPEPLATSAIVTSTKPGVQPPDAIELPGGGRPKTLRLVRNGQGVIAVVTVDAPPSAPRTSDVVNGEPIQQETLRLSIAPDVKDGLGLSRIDVEFPYPTSTCGQPKCPLSTVASVLIGGSYLGTVPVTVSGRDIRFDLGHFTASKQPAQAPPSIPSDAQFLGLTKDTITLDAQDLDMVPVNPTSPPWTGQTTITLDGTTISITSPSGATAKGVVNPFTGYFFAADSNEMWSGFLGKEGWYERIDSQVRKTAARTDIGPATPDDEIVPYYWNQKLRGGVQSLPLTLRTVLNIWKPDNGFGNGPKAPQAFTDAVNAWLEEIDAWDLFLFPFGFDPVVVPMPAAIPFPFAKSLPALGRQDGQWEIAAGIQLAGAHGNLVFGLGPYVPASSLIGK